MVVRFGLAIVLAMAGCATSADEFEAVPDRASRRAALVSARSFLPVLSAPAGHDLLAGEEVVILDPDPYTADDIAALRREGVLSLGYVNIGEAETWRSFYDDVDRSWILGINPVWEGHEFVDAREEGWQSLVVDRVAGSVVAKEFDGLFLDMADVASPGVHPETREGMEALILRLRATYPTHLLVMNRGLFLLDAVEPALDGLVVEGVFSRHDFKTDRTIKTEPEARRRLVAALDGFRERTGGAALVIDYADTDVLRRYAQSGARREGFTTFIGSVELGRTGGSDDA